MRPSLPAGKGCGKLAPPIRLEDCVPTVTIRLLALSICIAACPDAVAVDERPGMWRMCPLEDAIPSFPDATPPTGTSDERLTSETNIDGDSLSGEYDSILTLEGNVTLRRADQFLAADNLQLDNETGRYVASEGVRYQDSGIRLTAEHIEGNPSEDSHSITGVRYQLLERRGNGGAEHAMLEGDRGSLYGSTYTTCPPSERLWWLDARRIDIDLEEGFGTARGATVRLGRVPILYMPWFKFPIDDRRQTGLLYPSIGLSGRNGFDWRQPIYLNLAPNYDMTLEPRVMSDRGILLGTEFRYLTRSSQGILEFEYLPSDDLAQDGRQEEIDLGVHPDNWRKETRGMVHYSDRHNLNRIWQVRNNLNWVSDPRYIEDMSNSLSSLTSTTVNSDIGIYGRGRYWEAGLRAEYQQLADYTLLERQLPYNRLPRLYGRWEQPLRPWLVASVNTDLTRFSHTDGSSRPGGSRLDVEPQIAFPLEGAAWYVTPSLAWRYTAYQLDRTLAEQIATGIGTTDIETSPSRSLPIASLDAGLFFDRETQFRGERFLHTIEPRLFYLNVPYRYQDNLPRFDTNNLTFSWSQLFRDNRFSGADRQSDANQLTLAVSTRMIRESDGLEKFSASVGQIRYFEDSRVGLSPSSPPLESGQSSWVAESSYAVNDRWTISAGYQWDPEIRREDLMSLRTRYLIGDYGIANFAYRYRRDMLEQVDLSFLYPINDTWSLIGRYYYSITDRQVLEGIGGVQWENCCMAVRLVGRRYVRNRQGEMNDAVQLEVEFKGLSSAGPGMEDRLRRAILGYYREDLYLIPPTGTDGGEHSIDPLP